MSSTSRAMLASTENRASVISEVDFHVPSNSSRYDRRRDDNGTGGTCGYRILQDPPSCDREWRRCRYTTFSKRRSERHSEDDISTAFGRNVYRYDIYNGAFTGPYEPTLIDQLYAGPFVGPDDNVWTVRLDADPHHYYWPMAFQVFVRKIQTLEPTAISVSAGSPTSFAILETHLNGPWTSVSLNPSLATASPSSSTTGQFTVSETRPGNTSIKVTDKLGSSSYETVNVH